MCHGSPDWLDRSAWWELCLPDLCVPDRCGRTNAASSRSRVTRLPPSTGIKGIHLEPQLVKTIDQCGK